MARRSRRAPLPVRGGLNPTRLQFPRDASAGTVGDFLFSRFPDDVVRIAGCFESGEVVDELGRPYSVDSPARPGGLVFLYREPAPESVVPFSERVLFQDDDLVVVDKPHFLAVTPRGAYVRQTVLVRLRERLGLPELAPAHRLDRLTAGVLVLTARRELRRPYQELFAQRAVTKTYEAVAPLVGGMEFPLTVRSRIVKQHGVLQAQQVPGEPNAITRIELVRADRAGEVGLFRLFPETGRTHQLRVHMSSLDMPIVGDDLYPVPALRSATDYSNPLQLLARSIEFVDPLSGAHREFRSERTLTELR